MSDTAIITTGTDETPAIPAEVWEIVNAIRAFTETVEGFEPERFVEAVEDMSPADLAYIVDRIDDVRAAVIDLLNPLSRVVSSIDGEERHFELAIDELNSAGDSLHSTLTTLDPDFSRLSTRFYN